MREQRNDVMDLFESWDSPVFLVDSRGVIDGANQAALQTFGYDIWELTGNSLRMLAPPDIRERTRWLQAIKKQDDSSVDAESISSVRCMTSFGSVLSAHISSQPIGDQAPGYSWVMVDVGETLVSPAKIKDLSAPAVPDQLDQKATASWGSWLDSRFHLEQDFASATRHLRSLMRFDQIGIVAANQKAGTLQLCHREIINDRVPHPRKIGEKYSMTGTIIERVIDRSGPVIVAA